MGSLRLAPLNCARLRNSWRTNGQRTESVPDAGIRIRISSFGSSSAYHIGMLAVSGFGVDHAENTNFSNPILTPQAPNGFGFGRIRSNDMLVTAPIGIARQLTERFSVGFSAVPSFSMLQVIPAPFSLPSLPAAPCLITFRRATMRQLRAGFNAGAHYAISKVSVGVSYRSPVWFSHSHLLPSQPSLHDVLFQQGGQLIATN